MNKSKEWLEDIKNNLTIEQIKDLLFSFGADPIIKNNIIISKTVCHNDKEHLNNASYKLYYYDNTKLFKCFTECNSSFDVIELVMKVKHLEMYNAINYIISFFNLTFSPNNFLKNEEELNEWTILNKYEQNNSQEKQEKIIEFKFYDDKILNFLPKPKITSWIEEGINQEIMDIAGIAFDPVNHAIVIPHRDIDGKLIGIRERTLIKEEEKNGKYKPAILNYQMYNHPLGFNLYNLNNSKDNIRNIKKAIVFEGEKSCLKYASYFGKENDISVAVCGSNITQYQIQLLKSLDVNEMILAFDKQWQEIDDNEFKNWTKKLTEINNKYSSLINISFIFDSKGDKLDYKDSPIDKGKEIFLELFERRISL